MRPAAAQGQAPTVLAVGFNGTPADGATYGRGETIWVWVQFTGPIEVSGSPRLTLAIGSDSRPVPFHSVGPDGISVFFAYVVQSADRDTDGIGIPANAVDLAGGAITLAGSSATRAVLTHDALDDDATRKVDGSLVPTPAIARVGYWGGPAEGDTYGFGETIWVEVVFSAAVAVSGRPQVALNVGGSARQATYHNGGGSTYLYFQYVVQSADRDTDGISIPANAVDLAGGAVTAEGSSTTDAELAHAGVPAEAGRKVNGRAGVGAPPAITDVRFPTGPADGVTYGLGEQILVNVEFDKQVAVRGRPQVELDVGGSPRQAALFRVGSPIVQFQYIVQSGDLDGDGIAIPANAVNLAGGAILLDLGGLSTPADLTHDAVPADPRHRVDGTLEAPPRITRVSFWSSPGNGDTYGRHETVWVEVAFDRAVLVTGNPRLRLTVGNNSRHATHFYQHERDKDAPQFEYFRYVVGRDDRDDDGIGIPANALRLAGGPITLAGSGTAAVLTHDAATGHKVDGALVEPPEIIRVRFWESPLSGQTYGLGETVEVQVGFNKLVEVEGKPSLELDVGGVRRDAVFRGLRSGQWAFFGYRVQETDRDDDGVGIPAGALDLAGGAIRLLGSATPAVLAHDDVAEDPNHRVDGTVVEPPVIARVRFRQFPAEASTYRLDEQIRARVAFSRPVELIGEPRLALDVGGAGPREAVCVGAEAWLECTYVVQETATTTGSAFRPTPWTSRVAASPCRASPQSTQT